MVMVRTSFWLSDFFKDVLNRSDSRVSNETDTHEDELTVLSHHLEKRCRRIVLVRSESTSVETEMEDQTFVYLEAIILYKHNLVVFITQY